VRFCGGVCLSLLTVGAAAAESPIECEGTEPFKFKVQASLNGGESWTSDYVLIWAQPGTSVDLAVRTCMSVSAGQTEGWSFSLRHDPSSVQAAGGDFQVIGVTTDGTDTETVKNGEPPGFEDTEVQAPTEGYTQGVVIDMDAVVTLDPCTDFVTSFACYRVFVPSQTGYYEVPIFFTHDLGDPPIDSIVVQEGQGNEPCGFNIVVGVYVSSYSKSYPPCTLTSDSVNSTELAASEDTLGVEADQEVQFVFADPVEGFIRDEGDQLGLEAIEAGDLNADGSVDLVVAQTYKPAVWVLWNDGSGNLFQDKIKLLFHGDEKAQITSVAVSDLDNDGYSDIVAAAGERDASWGVWVLWNLCEEPWFQSDEQHTSWIPCAAVRGGVAVGDIDQDERVDIAFEGDTSDFSRICLIKNLGDRTFELNCEDFMAEKGVANHLIIAEVNGYPGLELVVGNGQVCYWDPEITSDPFDLANREWTEGLFNLGKKPMKFTAGDLDDDDDQDIDFVFPFDMEDYLTVVENLGAGFTKSCEKLSVDGVEGRAVALGRLNADLRPDIAFVYFPANMELFSNASVKGLGCDRFPVRQHIETWRGDIYDLGCADLDGDTLEDLFLATGDTYVVLYFNRTEFFHRGDANSDGRCDIGDAIYILQYLFGGGPPASCMDSADANDDGKVNIADTIYLLSYLFGGESPPPAPGPCDYPCGPDRTVSDDLRCYEYSPCQ